MKRGFHERRDLVFLGSFRHDPNIDAVLFFAKEVWPLLADQLPEARFIIVGPEAPERIRQLHSERILVKGHVDDLLSVFESAKLSVAPLRYGAGIKGKILTSLGYGVPCVATDIACEGMGLSEGLNIVVANTPKEIAEAVVRIFKSEELWISLSEQGQDWVLKNYSQSVVKSRLLEVFNEIEKATT
jgi:glycosyltransferase involved in cell wall biosynthesis